MSLNYKYMSHHELLFSVALCQFMMYKVYVFFNTLIIIVLSTSKH